MSENNVKFEVESFVGIIDEAYNLWQEHHDELVGSNVEFLPDLQKYIAIEKNKHLRVFTIRDNKKLIGYAIFTVIPHHHRTQVIQAENTLFFITKAYRKGWLASTFIKYCEAWLFDHNVDQISMRTKTKASFGVLLRRLKYKEEEIVYLKKKG